jgi:hypothetical protein
VSVIRRLPPVAVLIYVLVSGANLISQEQCAETTPGKYSQTGCFYYTLTGGFEQVELSSQPSQTEPFVRLFGESGVIPFDKNDWPVENWGGSLWGDIRLLGAPNQNDTKGVFSVFADPTGQITSQKLSSVGTSVDFMLGPALQIHNWKESNNKIQLVLGFGATTPLESNKVNQAFVVPLFGTVECNTLYKKFGSLLSSNGITKSPDGIATGTSSACLINTNSTTTTTSGATTSTTYAPINTLAFSSADRTSFLLKDFVGMRFSRGVEDGKDVDDTPKDVDLGSIEFGFGMDSSMTGGVFRGNRWTFRTDAIYPVIPKGRGVVYMFGSFASRLERNTTDNSPLILQTASLSSLTGSTGLPNVNTIVLPLQQPDRDFYRIGVGIDILALLYK